MFVRIRLKALTAATAIAILFGSNLSALSAGEMLSGNELKEFFSNKAYAYYKKNWKKHATIYYYSGGIVESRLEANGQTYTGKWYVRGDSYCTVYTLRSLKCFKVRATDSPNKFEDLYFGKIDGYFVRFSWSGV